MKQTLKTSAFVLLAFFMMAGMAFAQRGVPITEKPRPDYDPLGIRAGAFLVKPSVTLGMEYNDNIYATRNNTKSDGIATIAPRIKVDSEWSRHALGIDAGLKGGMYFKHSKENYLDAHFLVNGRVDVFRESYLSANAGFQRLHEERGSPDARGAWDNPSIYYRTTGNLSYHHGINRVSMTLGGGITNLSYQDVDLRAGGKESLRARDRNLFDINARLAYELLPEVQPFITASYDWRRYDKNIARRNSDGYRIGVGTGFLLGGVTTGEIYGGYMAQDYKDRQNISGAWYGMNLLWNVTELTSIQAWVQSSVKETTVGNASGMNAVDLGIRADHEVLRNLLAGAFFDYTHDKYKGVDITDNYYTFGPRLTYFWNRNLSFEASYRHKVKDGSPSTRDYTENLFVFSVTGGF